MTQYLSHNPVLTSIVVLLFSYTLGLSGCSGPQSRVEATHSALETQSLIITEVVQASPFDGAIADKVEVYCASNKGCEAFRVCDTASTGQTCSSVIPTMASGQRIVVSRGTSITNADYVWLANSTYEPLPGTRVGPFACEAQTSQSRIDCSIGLFGQCGTPNLGLSSGSCRLGDFSEPFVYEVGFTTNQYGQPETGCERPLCKQLVLALDAATTSIEFALYGVRGQPAVIDALVRAQARGVVVRGVVDSEDATCTKFGYSDTTNLINALSPGSVVCDLGPGYSYIMHNKFFVIDGAKVWTGSTNVSDTELGGEYNSDVTALFSSYLLAEIYSDEFEEMFTGKFHHRKTDNTEHIIDSSHFEGQATVTSYFSPTDNAIQNGVLPLIEQATETLDVAMFFFTNTLISDALVSASQRGVRVRLILDAGGAANAYSKHWNLCNAGIAVKVENWGGKSHSKWAVADSMVANRAAVVFGSMNFTAAGDAQNDENTLVVKHDGFAAEFQSEFERQWESLAQVPVCVNTSAEGADSSNCEPAESCHKKCISGSCCDGIDNDYDGRTDLAEESCGCADGIDNDGDGYTDRKDFDCQPVAADPQ
jgi:phosphatidylserine/phosphatidylglycerophosphate/cardiolipin synthase-like enzyme